MLEDEDQPAIRKEEGRRGGRDKGWKEGTRDVVPGERGQPSERGLARWDEGSEIVAEQLRQRHGDNGRCLNIMSPPGQRFQLGLCLRYRKLTPRIC